MGIFEDSLEASLLSIARNVEWANPSFPTTDGVADPSQLPELPTHGSPLRNSPKCLVWFSPRENISGHGARVRVTTVDDTATYTVTLGDTNTLDHDYAAIALDEETEILQGLADEINTGVDLGGLGGATIEYINANPDTITRSAGDWTADGVDVGDRITLTHTAANANDGIEYIVASLTATVLTLVAADAVTAVAPSTVTACVVRKPVVASVETRDGVPTLVITGVRVEDSEVDDPTNTYTTAVSATGSGELEFDEDATGGDITIFLTAAGVAAERPEADQWIFARNGEFTGIDHVGMVERVDCASFGRIYPQVTNVTNPTTDATVVYTIKVAPAILE